MASPGCTTKNSLRRRWLMTMEPGWYSEAMAVRLPALAGAVSRVSAASATPSAVFILSPEVLVKEM